MSKFDQEFVRVLEIGAEVTARLDSVNEGTVTTSSG
jgi:hypothetical protein